MNFKKFISGISALTIAASAFAGLAITANAAGIVGSTEMNTPYLTAFSDSITLVEGEAATFKFTCNSGSLAWYSWIACVHKPGQATYGGDNIGDRYYSLLRGDYWDDVNGIGANAGVTLVGYSDTDLVNATTIGAVATFTYTNGSVKTHVDITDIDGAAKSGCYEEYTVNEVSGAVEVFLSVNQSYLNVTSSSKTKYVVPSGYDAYGIGEIVFGTEYSDGTVADETFDSFPTPESGSNGWSGTMTNVGLATDVSRYLNINENAAAEQRHPENIANNYIALSGAALRWSKDSAPVKSFTNAVSHGIVRFNASYYQGTHRKTVAVRDSSGNPVIKLGYSADKSGALSSDLFTMGTTVVGSALYVRSASMRVKNVAIDLDKGTITYDADYCNRISSKDGVTSVTNQKAVFSNTDIKDIAFTSEATNKDYYANLDNVALYATMPTTRHAVTFTVTDTHTPAAIEGATVSVSGYRSATTDANGQATLYIDEADMSSAISVTKDGYANGTGTITEDNGIYTCAVAMDEPKYTGTITTNPNTTVTVTGTSTQGNAVNATVVSNYQGVAAISAYAGSDYTVTASKNGYTQNTTSITITNDNAATASVSLSPSTSGVVYYEDFNNGTNLNFTSSGSRRWNSNRYQITGTSGNTTTLGISNTSYDIYTITATNVNVFSNYNPSGATANSSSFEIRQGDTTFAGVKVSKGKATAESTSAYSFSGYVGISGNQDILDANNAYNALTGNFVVTIDNESGDFVAKLGDNVAYTGTVSDFDISDLTIYMASGTNAYPGLNKLTITGSNYPSISKPTAANGTYTVTAGGSEISKAKAGTTVTVTPTADSDYELGSIIVTKDSDSSEVILTNNTFEMPDEPVTVTVSFVPIGDPGDVKGSFANTNGTNSITGTNIATNATLNVSQGGSGANDAIDTIDIQSIDVSGKAVSFTTSGSTNGNAMGNIYFYSDSEKTNRFARLYMNSADNSVNVYGHNDSTNTGKYMNFEENTKVTLVVWENQGKISVYINGKWFKDVLSDNKSIAAIGVQKTSTGGNPFGTTLSNITISSSPATVVISGDESVAGTYIKDTELVLGTSSTAYWLDSASGKYYASGDAYTVTTASELTQATPVAPSANFVKNDWIEASNDFTIGTGDDTNVLTNAAGKKMYAYKAELTGNGITYETIKGDLKASDDTTGTPEWSQRVPGSGSFILYLITNKALNLTDSVVYCE